MNVKLGVTYFKNVSLELTYREIDLYPFVHFRLRNLDYELESQNLVIMVSVRRKIQARFCQRFFIAAQLLGNYMLNIKD